MTEYPPPTPLWRGRLHNLLQSTLILLGLGCLMAIPAWLFAGPAGLYWALLLVVFGAVVGGRMPARYVLARSGASQLHEAHAPHLYTILRALYERARMQARPALFYVPDPNLNAFATGNRQNGGVAVSAGLLGTLNLRQLAGVLAHEVSHLRNGDTRVMALAAAMSQFTVWSAFAIQVLLILMLPGIIRGDIGLPWLALLFAALAPTVSTLLQLALSRNREYMADLEAVAMTGDPQGLAEALQIIEHHHGSWLRTLFGHRPPPFLKWLQTHPPTTERIRRLMALRERSDLRPLDVLRRTEAPSPIPRPAPDPILRWLLRRY
jgi:heat shock protein HtpX